MTLYVIRGDSVTAYASPPATISEGEVVVQSIEDIEASGLSIAELAAIWNALPGATKLAKFKDRKAAARRLWAAFAELPVDPERAGSPAPRAGSKQAQVIDLFRRAEGATVAEVIAATGWQPHTVRGIVSGTLKKKLGLTVVSAKEERGTCTALLPRRRYEIRCYPSWGLAGVPARPPPPAASWSTSKPLSPFWRREPPRN